MTISDFINVVALGFYLFILVGCERQEAIYSGDLSVEREDAGSMQNVFDQRRSDWRIGPITYQIFIDRFVPPADIDAKRHHYTTPRSLHEWSEHPVIGQPDSSLGVWTHELAFWGGDLNGVQSKIGYLDNMGVDVVYLNPIHNAFTNHKYDAIDYMEIAPEFGTVTDLKELSSELHQRDMKLILDGVFNHIGKKSDWFVDAASDEESVYRDWFVFDENYQYGYLSWWGVENLPELNWENPEVVYHLVDAENSVVRSFFDYGIDGWRLDVAQEMGFDHLQRITNAAHERDVNSLVIGEVWNYPAQWTQVVDGIMNFPLREIMFLFLNEELTGAKLSSMMGQMVDDANYEGLLRSWLILDNHDTPRLKSQFPDQKDREFLQTLQFVFPGAPLLYYGVEAGMEGRYDPENRGPMAWDQISDDNDEYARVQELINWRNNFPALRIGDYVPLETASMLSFLRTTDRVAETVLVVANNSYQEQSESLLIRDSRLMSGDEFVDVKTGETFRMQSAVVTVAVPPRTVRVMRLLGWQDHAARTGHSPYKNIP